MEPLKQMLYVLIGMVLQAFMPAAFDEFKRTFRTKAEDAKPQPELKARLRRRIRSRWRGVAAAGLVFLGCLAAGGCGTRTVFISPGEPVQLRRPIRNARVWVVGADGKRIAAKVDLAEGWHCLSDTEDDVKPAETAVTVPEPVR